MNKKQEKVRQEKVKQEPAKQETATQASSPRYKSFDAFKGLVILICVTIGHYWQFTPGEYYADGPNAAFRELTNHITRFSFIHTFSFMEFLFLIAGFQMFRYIAIIAEDKISFTGFMSKRLKRLYPMYFITTILMVAGLVIYYKQTGETWYSFSADFYLVAKNLLCIQAWNTTVTSVNAPLWFVSVMIFCLLLFYVLSRFTSKTKLGVWLMAIPFVVGILYYTEPSAKPLLNPTMCRGYIGFFAGVLLAYISAKLSRKAANIYSVVALCGYLFIYTFYDNFIYESMSYLGRSLPAVLFLYAPLILLVTHNPVIDKIIGNPVLEGLGKISYVLYTINFPFYIWVTIMNRTFKMDLHYGYTYMYWVMAAIQVVIAIPIYMFVDKPIRKKLA